MGFWRSVYWLVGVDYYGSEEYWQDRQKHLKYNCCKQITSGGTMRLLPMQIQRIKKRKQKTPPSYTVGDQ